MRKNLFSPAFYQLLGKAEKYFFSRDEGLINIEGLAICALFNLCLLCFDVKCLVWIQGLR